MVVFFFYVSGAHRDLLSFPTRRSSDLLLNNGTYTFSGYLYIFHVLQCIGASLIIVILLYGLNRDRKSTRLNSSHVRISYAVFCLKSKYNNATIFTLNLFKTLHRME